MSHMDNFYIVEDAIDTPSTNDGVGLETCSMLRHFGAELIQTACILLNCQQVIHFIHQPQGGTLI